MKAELVIRDVKIFQSSTDLKSGDIAFYQGKIIHTTGKYTGPFQEELFFNGAIALPGIIDSQVHFREPGPTHKEDLETGSQSAVMGGVTTFFEMPNTNPSTSTIELLTAKCQLAAKKSWANYGFFIGATKDNLGELKKAEELKGCIGVKIFLGSSTGNLLLFDTDSLLNIFSEIKMPISIHSEDEEILKERMLIFQQAKSVHAHPDWRNVESALKSTQRIVSLAREKNKKIHLLHITSQEEMEFLAGNKDICTVEVTPQHLTLFAPECYDQLGTLAQMNPPIREKRHQEALWAGIKNKTVDIIGSDHAPHTLQEKGQSYPQSPSGMPGVQTTLQIMLNHVHNGKLNLADVVRLLSQNPATIFGLKSKGKIEIGADADLTIIDLEKSWEIKNEEQKSKVNWSPFHQKKGKGQAIATIVSGKIAMKEGQLQERNGLSINRK